MPLIAKNITIINSDKSSQASAPVVKPTTFESLRASVSNQTETIRRPEEKKVEKKDKKSSSAYLLDMVTIDEL